MLIYQIINACNARYSNAFNNRNQNCSGCFYWNTPEEFCSGDCGVCLNRIHYPSPSHPAYINRKYTCPDMCDYYVCKYACKYTSEIIHAFMEFPGIFTNKTVNVLSLGCGPCTDLFALDYLRDIYNTKGVVYYGIDYDLKAWEIIHNGIDYNKDKSIETHFEENDICKILPKLIDTTWIPNIITLQYVFSDMQKHSGQEITSAFVSNLAQYINTKLHTGCRIFVNDINLCCSKGGGRDYFDQLANLVNHDCVCQTGHFHNDSKIGYNYGEREFPDNSNFFPDMVEYLKPRYNTFDTCSSAQMEICVI